MLDLKTTILRQRELKAEAGTSNWWDAIKIINRERVNSERGKKTPFTWAQIKRAYKRQRGICPVCHREMALERTKVHGDHWDPNMTEQAGLNRDSNCACTHAGCNLHKSSKSPAELSKLRQLNPTMGEEE